MALVSSSRFNDDWGLRRRDPLWESRLSRRWEDWPTDWPEPKTMIDKFWADTDRWWKDWPTNWPRMDAVMPRSTETDFDSDVNAVMPLIRREYRQLREYESQTRVEPYAEDAFDDLGKFPNQQSVQFVPQSQSQSVSPNVVSPAPSNRLPPPAIVIDGTQDVDSGRNVVYELDQSLPLQFSNHLDRIDRNWRSDPFWRDLYPRWAEPIFKEGIDVKANIVNDRSRFAVDIDAYQFKPEELQVKTLDDTLLIEGRHEDVKDSDNFTKMYFIRKYQLPGDVDPQSVSSAIDGNGRLTVEAPKRYQAIDNRERMIPIEGPSKRTQSRSSSYSPRERHDSGRGSDQGYYRNESRQSNYSDRYAQDQQQSSPRGYIPKLTTPAPIVNQPTNGYRRSEFNSRITDSNGYRSENRREEYRSDSRNGETTRNIPVIRSSSVAPPPQDTWRSESRNDYRVDSPASNGLLRRADDRDGNRSESRSESVRSVKILRKTFE